VPIESEEIDRPLRADLHIHTEYSMDSASKIEDIISTCAKKGINCLSVTDHGAIEGAVKMQKIAPFKVIISEEILTRNGEIIGMFLKEKISGGLSPQDTVSLIKEQGGLVYIPHPFDRFRSPLDEEALEEIIGSVDIIEVYNARIILLRDISRAQALAEKYNLPMGAGSDAHTLGEIGKSWVEMPDFDGPPGFLKALRLAKIHGHRSSPFVHISSSLQKKRKHDT